MSKTNLFEQSYLEHVFNNSALANIGDAAGLQPSAAAGNLYLALLKSDPGEEGSQADEADYTNYARVAIARSGAGWTVVDGVVSNTAQVQFPECGAVGCTVTHVAILTAAAGGDMLVYGELNDPLIINNLIAPTFEAGLLTLSED